MSFADLFVVGIILIFAVIGMSKGLVLSVFRLASFFAAYIISIKFYTIVSDILIKTPIYTSMKKGILDSLWEHKKENILQMGENIKNNAAETLIEGLKVPGFLKKTILGNLPDTSSMLDIQGIMEMLSEMLAKLAIDAISLVLVFILVRIGLIFVRFILKGVTKVPVIKQADKIGGLTFGVLEGVLTVFVVFAVVIIFNQSSMFSGFISSIERSFLARYFYENNFIINFIL